jgi:ATP-dependent Clp protease ATP-binding subunit ClpB
MRLQKLLADKKVSLELTAQARELLFKQGYDPAYGARPLRRALQQLVQDKLALKMLDGEILPGDHVVADANLDRGELVFEKASHSKQR